MSQKNDKKSEVEETESKPSKSYIFPKISLSEALKVAEIIWEKNSGNPFTLFDIAGKVGTAPTTSGFRELIRSSQKYGLTNEGMNPADFTKTISLTPLGNSIVAPTPDDNIYALKRQALEKPEIFQKVLNALNGKIIPDKDVFQNMLIRNYSMNKNDAEDCYEILIQNINELGITDNYSGKTYLRLDKLSTPNIQELLSKGNQKSDSAEKKQDSLKQTALPENSMPSKEKLPSVFISHSKNKKILDQIKQVLAFGKFQFEIAEDRETLAIPLSDKVFNLMRKCNCAIINISADEEKKQGENYGMNENVLIEIGGSFLHYNRNVILVIDKRFSDTLPSMLKGLTAIFYEGDALSWNDGMRLQNALTEFRNKL